MKRSIRRILFLALLLPCLIRCGGSDDASRDPQNLELTAPAPVAEKVPMGYAGLATNTAEPSLVVRVGPGRGYPRVDPPLTFAATVQVSATEMDNAAGQLYANIQQGWVDTRWLKMGSFVAPATRQGAIEICRAAVGYSYWWGGAAFQNGAERGACSTTSSDGCPDCVHSGAHGADCSGLISKCWQLTEALPMERDLSPYSTAEYINPGKYWDIIDRADAKAGDALVYRSNGKGHIVLVEKSDAWGQLWVYEARGCRFGIVHDLRSFGEEYKAIRHKDW